MSSSLRVVVCAVVFFVAASALSQSCPPVTVSTPIATRVTNGFSLSATASGGSGHRFFWHTGVPGAGTPIGEGNPFFVGVPSTPTTFFVRVTNDCGNNGASPTIVLGPCPAVTARTPTVTPVAEGFLLTASATGGEVFHYNWHEGNTPPQGPSIGSGATITVNPRVTTSYWYRATNQCESTGDSPVVVVVPRELPAVAIAAFPRGMVQRDGEATGTDAFFIVNSGTAATTVTLSTSSTFFSMSPTSVTLAPGASQEISIRALVQPAGTYEGIVSISGNGAPAALAVKVRLLVASGAPVTGSPLAPVVPRQEIAAPANVNPSGTILFRNGGNVTLRALASADVPWVTLPSPAVTIDPGAQASVPFEINRSLRPDADALLGSAGARVTLQFLAASTGPSQVTPANGTSTAVSTNLVDVVQPGLSPGAPAPLAAGELAVFAAGLPYTSGIASDLLLSNRSASGTISDLRLYAAQPGAAFGTFASISSLPKDVPVLFAGIAKTVFGIEGRALSVQLRSRDSASLAVGALKVSARNGTTRSTALPIFRTDRSAGAGQRLFLTGVEKSASIKTALYLQEVAGSAVSLQIDFLDAAGAVISSRPGENLPAFGYSELVDIVPSGALAVRIANVSGGRVSAYAIPTDDASGNEWTVVDTQSAFGATSSTLIIPVATPPRGDARYDVFVTNTGSSPISADIISTAPARRRSVGREGRALPPATDATQNVTIAPLQTVRVSPSGIGSGVIKVTASSVNVNASARVTTTTPSAIVSLPVVPAAAGLSMGQIKRFAGLDDAEITHRSGLILIETGGSEASVRATLRFNYAAGSKVSAAVLVSKQFDLTPNQHLVIADLARAILGESRNSIGDLRNMQLDVETVSGSGRVFAFVQMNEPSGNIALRSD